MMRAISALLVVLGLSIAAASAAFAESHPPAPEPPPRGPSQDLIEQDKPGR